MLVKQLLGMSSESIVIQTQFDSLQTEDGTCVSDVPLICSDVKRSLSLSYDSIKFSSSFKTRSSYVFHNTHSAAGRLVADTHTSADILMACVAANNRTTNVHVTNVHQIDIVRRPVPTQEIINKNVVIAIKSWPTYNRAFARKGGRPPQDRRT